MYMQIADKPQISQEVPPRHISSELSLQLPPLKIRLTVINMSLGKFEVDAILQIEYEGSEHTFLAEYKSDWTQRTFQAAIDQVLRIASPSPEREVFPLVILPYLSEEHITELATRRISGLDLCGNGVITVPGKWFVQRSGKPNRFKMKANSDGVNPYRGRAAMVARTLLRRSQFLKLGDLCTEIWERGGTASLSLVSRVIQRLEEDLIVMAQPGMRVRLIQPEKLLDGLLRAFPIAREDRPSIYRVALPTTEFLPRLFQAAQAHNIPISVTGLGSAARYAPISLEDMVKVYSSNSEALIENLPIKPGERFANLEIHAPRDPVVYFDTEWQKNGIIWASPVQAYLEMMQSGDARLQDGAQHIRQQLLFELKRQQEEV